MKDKEFNLGEKMKKDIKINGHFLHCEVFEKDDVKEFIRLLKELNRKNCDDTRNANLNIDKLAGEELVR